MSIKPIIKWVGGKTQILGTIMKDIPKFKDYHDIFLGGGSVLFAILEKYNCTAFAYDINEPLIYMYKNIQKQPHQLYSEISILIKEFNSCSSIIVNRNPENRDSATSRESYYYWIRKSFNKLADKQSVLASAMFIFLNKTCFRGLYREGPNGFNVPYGHYKNPEIINEEHLMVVSKLIANTTFECCDFSVALKRVKPGDFVYLDPPYVPETTKSFVSYTANGFSLERHLELFSIINKLHESNKAIILLSNSDTTLVRENFTKFSISSIACLTNY